MSYFFAVTGLQVSDIFITNIRIHKFFSRKITCFFTVTGLRVSDIFIPNFHKFLFNLLETKLVPQKSPKMNYK